MDAQVELSASRALFAARAFERAVHDHGPWRMGWGGVVVDARRSVSPDGVRFEATFPDTCWLTPPQDGLVLLCDGDVVGLRRADHPGDTAFTVTWRVGAQRVAV